MRRTLPVVLVLAALATCLPPSVAADPVDSISGAATVTAFAEPITTAVDIVAIQPKVNLVPADIQASATAVADSVRAAWAFGRGAGIGLNAIHRGDTVVQQAPVGYHFPMTVTVLPPTAVGAIMGRGLAGVLATGAIVMGATTAGLRGAQAGDTVDLQAADGSVATFVVGAIAPDATVGGSELLLAPDQADVLGITTNTSIIMWGFPSRDALVAAVAASGLDGRTDVRVRHSWDPPDPDSTLGLARTKALLGEFAFQNIPGTTNLRLSPEWEATYLPAAREVFVPEIPVKAQCNVMIRSDLQAALADVASAGLGGYIDIASTNTTGGCFNPRMNRISASLGFVSRHAWAQAIDMNVSTNPQGSVPRMNCDVVRIFRRHNFAWGGNFLTPDGMHFEWVGQPRDQLQYPSRYCPNLPPITTQLAPGIRPLPADAPTIRSMFFSDSWSMEISGA